MLSNFGLATGIAVVLCCSACAPQFALEGVPELADGEDAAWVYHCDEANLDVEYANRSGHYTATLGRGAQKRVLDVTQRGEHGIVASLPPLIWQSEDGHWFTLEKNHEVILHQCRALRKQVDGAITLDLDNIFGRHAHEKLPY